MCNSKPHTGNPPPDRRRKAGHGAGKERVDPLTGDEAPGLARRLAAIVYDALLLFAVLLVAGLPLPLIPPEARESWWAQSLTRLYLGSVCGLFFTWFWVHGGQTLGMRAWRLRLVSTDGSAVSWRAAWIRALGALLSWAAFGLGYLWVLIDAEARAWHDRLSRTRLKLEPRRRR